MMQAIASCRPGGHLGYVGVAHGVSLPGDQLFFAEIHMLGGPAPGRRLPPGWGVRLGSGLQEHLDGAALVHGLVGLGGLLHELLPGGDTGVFFPEIHMLGGPAPVRRFLPDLIDRILKREINPGKVFTLRLPLEEAAEAYKAMDERRAITVLLERWTCRGGRRERGSS